ncbi:GNAT family N-acetyltransferase [Thalassovita sp.]|uniref:GNAT family N-acetyltransferase n=1 Tax=Thalassovita sp. TaxID=1979401 RepID=UPI0029DE69F6|nr:GNAT family N-acetyltransferase [Thalassovita sp.]
MAPITFARLPQVDPARILAHMSDPRLADHLPLLTPGWTLDTVAAFVAAKESCWQRDGLGHWAILHGGDYAGWGGFQKEGTDWDYGLVLRPDCFGLGLAITRQALDFARSDPRIPSVTFLLPPSRRHLGALARMGAHAEGMVEHSGQTFRKFRLPTA